MIKVDYTLLSPEALDNLIIDIITRESTDYGEFTQDIERKKNQLIQQLKQEKAIIIYNPDEEACDIIKAELFIACQVIS